MENKKFDWFSPVSILKGVGPKISENLTKLQIYSLGDLLLHCPHRYEDRTQVTSISNILPDQLVLIEGDVIDVHIQKIGKKRAKIVLADETGEVSLLFFHFHVAQFKEWIVGSRWRCFGQATPIAGKWQLVHPECERSDVKKPPATLTPVYPTVDGLSQNWFRKTIHTVLEAYTQCCQHEGDYIPTAFSLVPSMPPMMPWLKAIQTIHFPFPCDQPSLISKQHPAFKRLIIDELFAHVYSLEKFRQTIKANAAPELIVEEDLLQRFLLSLPFTLTHAQTNAWQQIREDLNKKSPMLRLVQGDVGCGKTIVAALATLVAVSSKSQVAIMAPTEILAEQLFNQFTTWFSVLDLQAGYRCELLTSKLTAKQKRSVLENITLGLANIVVGTHALFQEAVKFHNLGLLVIDEQHRFGVHQRLALQNKGSHPHQLIMTATPIPRTLLMSHYAHVDVSVINMLPPGRQQIKTLVLSQQRRVEIIERISAICNQDQQVYWVCTLISESDTLTCQAAQTSYETLQTLLPNFRVGLVHGKMDHQAKENMMQEFYKGDIQILVATTVIEVGVNVPNATLMVIENPERLGLAQLHQLRGRVGRGSAPSFCILLYQGPLSETAQARLRILRETSDGFEIAKADLELRGPGEILGVKQTGLKAFKVADLKRDEALLELLVSEKNEQAEKIPSQVLQNISLRWKVSGEYGQV